MPDRNDDDLRGIGISPRERLAHIEESLIKIDSKLDIRFDLVEKRLGAVENAQAGQASTAEFLAKARELAEETSAKAAGLAATETEKAVALVDVATQKALDLADQQKNLQQSVTNLETKISANASSLEDFDVRQDHFDKKVSWGGGIAAAAVFASYFIGYFNG